MVPPSAASNENETPTEIPETPPEALVDLVQLDGPQLLNHDLLRKMQGVIISSVVPQHQEFAALLLSVTSQRNAFLFLFLFF